MQNFALSPDLLLVAKTVWLLSGGEAGEAQVALAWLIRNRADVAARRVARCDADHPVYGDGSLAAACRSVLDEDGTGIFSDPLEWAPLTDGAFNRVLANVWLVWNGDLPDPTAGAVRFHRHDQTPCWSATCKPSALMGKRIYYRSGGEPVSEPRC
ncbi:MAG: hypothetical protein K8F25_02185 [Fimbriimonadaceae bacterium]|nr:hypothetical protein [Alphaproteobacteria bacterium]